MSGGVALIKCRDSTGSNNIDIACCMILGPGPSGVIHLLKCTCDWVCASLKYILNILQVARWNEFVRHI